MSRIATLARIFDFFIPAEVLSSVLLVFAMENVIDAAFSLYVPGDAHASGWLVVYLLGAVAISGLNYLSADHEEREELNDDLDSINGE